MNIIKPHKYVGFFTYSEDKPTSSGSVGLAIALFRVLRPATLTHYVRNSIIAQNSPKGVHSADYLVSHYLTLWGETDPSGFSLNRPQV